MPEVKIEAQGEREVISLQLSKKELATYLVRDYPLKAIDRGGR